MQSGRSCDNPSQVTRLLFSESSCGFHCTQGRCRGSRQAARLCLTSPFQPPPSPAPSPHWPPPSPFGPQGLCTYISLTSLTAMHSHQRLSPTPTQTVSLPQNTYASPSFMFLPSFLSLPDTSDTYSLVYCHWT